jgi:filamentous hemagglutinin family protein
LAIDHEIPRVPGGSVRIANSTLRTHGATLTGVVSGGTIDASLITLSAQGDNRTALIGVYGPSIVLDSTSLAAYTLGGPAGPAHHITISGGSITINDSSISSWAETIGGGVPIGIDVTAAGDLQISRSNIWIGASDAAAGGTINMTAGGAITLLGDDSGIAHFQIQTFGSDAMRGGDIAIKAHDVRIDSVEVGTYTGSGAGNAGHLHIDAEDQITVVNAGAIRSSTDSANAAAGTIELNAAHMSITGGGIQERAHAGSSGQLGDINVNASASLSADFPGILLRYDAPPPSTGLRPATIAINTPSLEVVGWARIGAVSLDETPPNRVLVNGQPYVQSLDFSPIKLDDSWGRTARSLPWSDGVWFRDDSVLTLAGNVPGASVHKVDAFVYLIGEDQGKIAGSNLFHSFDRFSVSTNDAVLFTTATPTLQNVIARVSGSSASTIDGLLLLRPALGSHPNFFFINPAGVTFSQGSQIDVPGAFHVSTANALRFADGSGFDAGTGASGATLTSAAPQAFEFSEGSPISRRCVNSERYS